MKRFNLLWFVEDLAPLETTLLALIIGSLLVSTGWFGGCQRLGFSTHNPIGIITSIFTHVSPQHLNGNLMGLAFYTTLTVLSTGILSFTAEDWRTAKILSMGYVYAAFLPHLLILAFQLHSLPEGTVICGMSLAVFSIHGYAFILSVTTLLVLVLKVFWLRVFNPLIHFPESKIVFLVLSVMLLLASLSPMIEAGSLQSFFGGEVSQANVEGHFFAMICGTILGFISLLRLQKI